MRSELWIFAPILLALAAGGGRLAMIVHRLGPDLREQASRQQRAVLTIPAQRGDILDTNGRVLAGSIRRPSIYVDPALVSDPRYAAWSIAPVLNLPPEWLESLLLERREDRFVWVKREINAEELEAFKTVQQNRRLSAFGVRWEPRRDYPFEQLAAAVLGFVGAEQRGLAGIEQSYDAVLMGRDGRRESTVDARRRRLRARPGDEIPPRDGASIVLTIDAHLQQSAEMHLNAAVKEHKARWGVAILMDPQTGEILAMANAPGFDPANPVPKELAGKPEEALERIRNRAIADAFEPGSIFKPFVAAPALEAGLVRMDQRFTIGGREHRFGSRIIHDTKPHDVLTLSGVISKSSNIGMGMLGDLCGNGRLHEFVRRFGFGQLTGIKLPGEHAGLVAPFSTWTKYSTQSIPIGQEIGATPLQLLTAFCPLANDGTLYQPRIVRGVIGAQGEILADESEPVVMRRVLQSDTARRFRSALVDAVNGGTGTNAQLKTHQVFGKTGTAQYSSPGRRGYVPGQYVGSFMGGAPAEDPRVVVLVTICQPGGRYYYGGTVAAPTAKNILADALLYMRVPERPPVLSPANRDEPSD